MNKIALAVVLSATALSATPAMAQQVSGTVNVTGTVAGRCSVVESGAEKTTFTGNIDLGRLDAADGTLRSELTSSTTASPADAKKVTARVVCTSANPTIGVSATKLAIANAGDAGVGYANVIDYVAALRVKTASSTNPLTEVKFDTLSDSTPITAKLGARIQGGTDNNVEVNVSSLRTKGGAGNVLNEGTYNSVVSLSITPTI
ncbi:hypothetical protein G7078_00175 [Sphingomonas sinipercae]|uniref:Spore coat protein U domain-containing protein n=1 Tax=Sphingomonas sinipercae TaxID=2714944 RepID=A0A6G7ZKC0_9SPHN|nr:hypothetical protein [Sphingomonas sinipercae]QIL01365.1 hypothetical protein G7078_00175 [Sphingomonas sinipercae]